MTRVLWCPCYEPGSYFPAVPIALELRRRGHDVVVLCEPASEQAFRDLGFDFRTTSRTVEYAATAARPTDRTTKRQWMAGSIRAYYSDVLAELASSSYDLVLTDPLETGADFAAEAAGVPWASYAHFAMNENGADVPFMFHLWDREAPAEEAFIDWWTELREGVGLPPDPRPDGEHRWLRHSRMLTLMLGLPELVFPQGDLPDYAVRVGPTDWETPDLATPDWVAAVGTERPAVLASVSTSRQNDVDLVVAVAEALADDPVDVIATIPVAHDLPTLPANVQVGGFVSHRQLLVRVSVVACHAGKGTVTRAACAGVPMLLFPHGRDQFEVARGAVAAGVAVAFEGVPPVAEARDVLHHLLDDAELRRRSSELAMVAARYDAAKASADLVEQLAAGGVSG
ncbi:MAG TPA: nucleotide disphospho-sugar-binding domain-containing protein [Mycobacteriales bacterium]|jgi:UDP:flavonoid glycosyltransferase YjiC (YdhE family)|nr:nucleotide disphospho-sugar-binding domain-containing protein [Mycobacteriales bacterium]